MSETLTNPNSYASPNHGQDPTAFGPQPDDIAGYREVLANPSGVEFRPRVNAELTSTRIDGGSLGTFTNSDVDAVGLDRKASLKLAQQRYIAGALGLQVGETEVSTSSHTARAIVRLPDANSLPLRPQRLADGMFVTADGQRLSQTQADAIYSGHFIAANRQHFSKPGSFEELFRRVVDQAESGQIAVRDKAGDTRGACSMVRQVARVLGYEVGSFSKVADGSYVMPVQGVRPGFDDKFTHFKRGTR